MLWAKLMQLLGRNDTCHALRICEEQGLIDEGFSYDPNEGRPAMGDQYLKHNDSRITGCKVRE